MAFSKEITYPTNFFMDLKNELDAYFISEKPFPQC